MSILLTSLSTCGRSRKPRQAVIFSIRADLVVGAGRQKANDSDGKLARACSSRASKSTLSTAFPRRFFSRSDGEFGAKAERPPAPGHDESRWHRISGMALSRRRQPWHGPALFRPQETVHASSVRRRQTKDAFRTLHESGCFVIPNPWNVGTARYLQGLGFKALATTSSGFAHSQGYADGAHDVRHGARSFRRDRRGRRRAGQRRLRGRLCRRSRPAWPRTSRSASQPASPVCQSRISPVIEAEPLYDFDRRASPG